MHRYTIAGPYRASSGMTDIEKRRAKFFGALTCVGFLCLIIVEVLSS